MTPNIISYKKEFLAGLTGLGGGPTGLALGGAVAKKTYIEDLFSTYLYTGNDTAQVINNGIALGSSMVGNSINLSDTTEYEKLTRTSALSGVSAGKTFTLSAWVFIPNTAVYGQLFYVGNTGNASRVEIGFGNYINITARNSSNTKILDAYTASNVPITPGTWNHILVSMDMSNTSYRRVYVNDSNVSLTYDAYSNENILFNESRVNIFGQYNNNNKLFGNLSNFYFDQTYRNLATTSNRRLFYAADGTPATGQASLSPVIYYPFETLSTTNAGSGGDFTFEDNPTLSDFGPYKDSSGENGGLVITKDRDQATSWAWGSETLGNNRYINSDSISQLQTSSAYRTFNTNGFTIGNASITNQTTKEFGSWSFKKQKGFLDIVTFVGDGTSSRNIAHDLGSVPGWIVIMCTTKNENKTCWHRGLDAGDSVYIDGTNGASNIGAYPAQPTDTQFTIGSYPNIDGETYVAWIFAGGASPTATARSVQFDGNDSLTMSNADNAPGTGSFTFECWFKPTDADNDYIIFDSRASTNQSNGFGIELNTGGVVTAKVGTSSWISSGNYAQFDSGKWWRNQWNHVAVVWDGSVANLYFNGVKGYKSTTGYNFTSPDVVIGASNTLDWDFKGYISNVRLTTGQALYTNDFKVPTEPLTTTSQGAIASNVKILCCNNSSVTGGTSGTNTPTGTVGDPTASIDSPFDDPEGFQFGDKGDQNVIKCGSYRTDGSEDAGVYLGWEPQMVIIKRTDSSTGGSWLLCDNMRRMLTTGPGAGDGTLTLPLDEAGIENGNSRIKTTTTGFYQDNYGGGREYIYIAIRRSDGYVSKPAKAGTDIFALDTGNNAASYPVYESGFPVDFAMTKETNASKDWELSARMTASYYYKLPTLGQKQSSTTHLFDYQNGWGKQTGEDADYTSWMWQRRGQGFDVVSYQGVSGAYVPYQVAHNLAKRPEMLWIKNRDASLEWVVGSDGMTDWNKYMKLNTNDAELSGASTFGAAPTATHFTVGNQQRTNAQNEWYIALLFASISGISKVGSYTGSGGAGNAQNIGFQPRFLMVKRVDSSGAWLVFDSLRTTSNPFRYQLELNTSNQQDFINKVTVSSTGWSFIDLNINENGSKYLYYAHA